MFSALYSVYAAISVTIPGLQKRKFGSSSTVSLYHTAKSLNAKAR